MEAAPGRQAPGDRGRPLSLRRRSGEFSRDMTKELARVSVKMARRTTRPAVPARKRRPVQPSEHQRGDHLSDLDERGAVSVNLTQRKVEAHHGNRTVHSPAGDYLTGRMATALRVVPLSRDGLGLYTRRSRRHRYLRTDTSHETGHHLRLVAWAAPRSSSHPHPPKNSPHQVRNDEG